LNQSEQIRCRPANRYKGSPLKQPQQGHFCISGTGQIRPFRSEFLPRSWSFTVYMDRANSAFGVWNNVNNPADTNFIFFTKNWYSIF